MNAEGTEHTSLDDESLLLPEEEQLYREFQLYVHTFMQEAGKTVDERLDKYMQEMDIKVRKVYMYLTAITVMLVVCLSLQILLLLNCRG